MIKVKMRDFSEYNHDKEESGDANPNNNGAVAPSDEAEK